MAVVNPLGGRTEFAGGGALGAAFVDIIIADASSCVKRRGGGICPLIRDRKMLITCVKLEIVVSADKKGTNLRVGLGSSLNQGCSMASLAMSRLFGSYANKRFKSSYPSFERIR